MKKILLVLAVFASVNYAFAQKPKGIICSGTNPEATPVCEREDGPHCQEDTSAFKKFRSYIRTGYIKTSQSFEKIKPQLRRFWNRGKDLTESEWQKLKVAWNVYRKLH